MVASMSASTPIHTVAGRILDMDELAHAIVVAEGDLALVAEKLLGNANKEHQLLEVIGNNPRSVSEFSAKVRIFTLIKTLSAISALHTIVVTTAHEINPDKAVGLYIKMTDAVERLTKPPETPVNPHSALDPYKAMGAALPKPLMDAVVEQMKQLTASNAIGIEIDPNDRNISDAEIVKHNNSP